MIHVNIHPCECYLSLYYTVRVCNPDRVIFIVSCFFHYCANIVYIIIIISSSWIWAVQQSCSHHGRYSRSVNHKVVVFSFSVIYNAWNFFYYIYYCRQGIFHTFPNNWWQQCSSVFDNLSNCNRRWNIKQHQSHHKLANKISIDQPEENQLLHVSVE